jgi:hypothetical protein
MDGAPDRSETLTVRFQQFGGLSPGLTCIVRRARQKQPSALPNLATIPKPDVIDRAEWLDTRYTDAEFLQQFAADRLLRSLAFLNTSARRAMQDGSGLPICDFSGQEGILATDYAQGRLV